MGFELWQECISCKDKCCRWDVACPLFVTSQEMSKISRVENAKDFNKKIPCVFFNKKSLCEIHSIRPTDCRFFPLDIVNISGKFFWIVWVINCSISKQKDFEPYLKEFENELIPLFKDNLEDYSKFRFEELSHKYRFNVVREIRL